MTTILAAIFVFGVLIYNCTDGNNVTLNHNFQFKKPQ